MSSLLGCVRDAAEAEVVLAAGFDGVVIPGPDASPERVLDLAARAVVGWIDEAAGTLVLVRGGDRQRLAFRSASVTDRAVPTGGGAGETGLLVRSEGRLLDSVALPRLAGLIEACRARGLAVALAGALECPDIPRLLALGPTVLLIGRALRAGGRRDGPLDQARLGMLRALVPAATPVPAVARPGVAVRRDRIFVRDLVLSLDIGAYASESGRLQRVRFSVEAELAGAERPARSMGDVVSYDLITDAIHRIATSRRVEFVETLAEEIAAALLAVPRIAEVLVRVEKLDLGPGAVGVEIVRRAYDAA